MLKSWEPNITQANIQVEDAWTRTIQVEDAWTRTGTSIGGGDSCHASTADREALADYTADTGDTMGVETNTSVCRSVLQFKHRAY
jgi:hypothetical protein